MAIYLTSDLHLGHDKDFVWASRGFKSIQEMNETIIKNWNNIVTEEDEVFILGDLMLGNLEEGIENLKQLKGKIYVILGNHDTNNRITAYKNNGFKVLGYSTIFKYGKYSFYLSHYPTLTGNYDNDKPLKQRIINICGHTHTNDKFSDLDKGLIYHVELDAHNCTPVNIEQIILEIKEKN